MGTIHVEVAARSTASPAIVFALLKDGETWPQWAMFDSFELESPGQTEPMGVGAIRVLRTKVSCAREQVVELVPNARFSYILLSGFPLRDYRADVDLVPVGNGTAITWRSSFTSQYSWTGWFWRLFITSVLRTTAKQLASGAERM